MFLLSGIFMFKGHDKMTKYSFFREGSSLNKNAYNYIINGNYANGFFILSMIFALLGTSFIIIGYLDSIKRIKTLQNEQINTKTKNNFMVERILSDDNGENLNKKVTDRLLELQKYTIDSVNIIKSMNYGGKMEAYIVYH